ncbi:GNAT family N-acetyltransferase [Olivibacter domesticus]|nr:hypothetical protein [Olivibacter domesticus]
MSKNSRSAVEDLSNSCRRNNRAVWEQVPIGYLRVSESCRTLVEACSKRRNLKAITLKQILSLDRETSSENRSILLDKYLHDSMMYLEDETVIGYYLPSLGDGLIIAKTPAARLALTKLHLRKQDCLIFPQDNINLVNFLSDNGHTATSSTKRMRLGASLPLKMKNIYNRIGGNLG